MGIQTAREPFLDTDLRDLGVLLFTWFQGTDITDLVGPTYRPLSGVLGGIN